MSDIKYLASYHGPAHTPLDQEYMDGFANLYSAMQAMRNRQNGMDDVNEYRENREDGLYYSRWGVYYRFPQSTPEDYMDVYQAVPEGDGYHLGEWVYRLTVGPRGGIKANRTGAIK